MQYLLTPIKIRIKKIVDAKLNGTISRVSQKIPVKTKPKKLRKKKPGFMYFLVNSELRGKLNNIIIKRGIRLSRW
jgi:hypothetical protein